MYPSGGVVLIYSLWCFDGNAAVPEPRRPTANKPKRYADMTSSSLLYFWL